MLLLNWSIASYTSSLLQLNACGENRTYPSEMMTGKAKKKKACSGKSRPLLTYEKHQVQISQLEFLHFKLIGKHSKYQGLFPNGRLCCSCCMRLC